MSSNEGEGEGEAQGDGAGESSEEEGDGDEQTQASGQGGGGDEIDGEDNVDEFDVGMDGDESGNEALENAKEKNKEMVQQLMDDFKEQWEPAVDKLDKAAKAFEGLDLDDLADGPEGFDLTRGLCNRRDGRSSTRFVKSCKTCASCVTWCEVSAEGPVEARFVARRVSASVKGSPWDSCEARWNRNKPLDCVDRTICLA